MHVGDIVLVEDIEKLGIIIGKWSGKSAAWHKYQIHYKIMHLGGVVERTYNGLIELDDIAVR